MCGKFTHKKLPQQSWKDFHALMDSIGKPNDAPALGSSPMHFEEILRADGHGGIEAVPMRWGFAALGAANPSKPDHIHARAETLDIKPTFRDAFRERRGLLLVETFNEAEEITPTKTRQYIIAPKDGQTLAIAVLWESWQHPEQGELLTYVMVTTPSNALIATITDRMPAVLPKEHWEAWLGLTLATPEELKAMLQPLEGDWQMEPETKTPPPKKPTTQGELF